ncbi:hypothetical protein L3Q82_004437 [Scortum barcoo]|uniref:Uncharacterized protein n=1 Tax=Scortum barcoo TaxID=214431 RepID=A0ACB8VJM7_9TELE|nr:hypothetical protein L3Q82_004437 [Scortum barcoo]
MTDPATQETCPVPDPTIVDPVRNGQCAPDGFTNNHHQPAKTPGQPESFSTGQEMKITDSVEGEGLLESSMRLKPHEAQSYRKKALWVSWVSIVVTLILAVAAFKDVYHALCCRECNTGCCFVILAKHQLQVTILSAIASAPYLCGPHVVLTVYLNLCLSSQSGPDSSAFNTVIPDKLDTEAPQPGTAPIAVPSGGENRVQHILYTGPEHRHTTGLACSAQPLFTLFTSDCSTIHSTNTIVCKVCRRHHHSGPHISDNDETHYREEIQHLTQWCSNNNLVLNTSNTKEVIVDYRKSRRTEHAPLLIHGEAVERVNNIKFLGIHITSDLTWSMNTAHLVKKAQQRLFFLRKLKRAGLSPQLLTNFYRATTESILCRSATVWYAADALHKTEKT